MYLGPKKLKDPDFYEANREKMIETKTGATQTAFWELDGIISRESLAKQYFGKRQSWLVQKINGSVVSGIYECHFSDEEYVRLVDALRDIAKRLTAHADEIERAK